MKIKQNRAITLIVLIITIIILLILAGVTIATLTGENGILNRAEISKVKNEREEVVEKIKVAVMTSRTNTENIGVIDLITLEKELKNCLGEDIIIQKDGENQTLPWYVIKNSYGYEIFGDGIVNIKDGPAIAKVKQIIVEDLLIERGTSAQLKITTVPEGKIEELVFTSSNENVVTVDSTGKVSVPESATGKSTSIITITGKESTDVSTTCTVTVKEQIIEVTPEQIIANPKEYYGKQVVNYKVSDTDNNVYRIFYVDADNYFGDGANTVYLKLGKAINGPKYSTSYNADETKIKQLNPIWNKNKGDNAWTHRDRMVAWLSDPTKWTAYYNENDANYSIASPSIEMYVKSYNQVIDKNISTVTYDANNEGYTYGSQGVQTVEKYINMSEYNGLYGTPGATNYTFSSPHGVSTSSVCRVNSNYRYLTYGSYSASLQISPLISLKSTFTVQISI